MTPAAAAAAAAAAKTLELMERQTTIFLYQAIGTVVAILAAIGIAAWQTRTSRRLVAEQHANAIALAERQHDSNVKLANEQHEQTVRLMQAEWDRSNKQRDDARAEERGFAGALFHEFSVSLQVLKKSAENHPTYDEEGRPIYIAEVRPITAAFKECKVKASEASEALGKFEANMQLTLRGTLAAARFSLAFNNTARPESNAEDAAGTNPSLGTNPAFMAVWVAERIEEYEQALGTV